MAFNHLETNQYFHVFPFIYLPAFALSENDSLMNSIASHCTISEHLIPRSQYGLLSLSHRLLAFCISQSFFEVTDTVYD